MDRSLKLHNLHLEDEAPYLGFYANVKVSKTSDLRQIDANVVRVFEVMASIE